MPDSTGSEKLILLGTHDNYVHAVLFDTETKQFRKGKTTSTAPHPSWLIRHPVHSDIIYSNGWVEGRVFANRLVDSEGTLEVLSESKTEGKGPTHLALMPNNSALVIAHYGGTGTGATTLIPLLPSGLFDTSAKLIHHPYKHIPSPHPRQEAPHAHQVIVLPDGEILTPDLGSDRVQRTRLNAQSGTLDKVGEFSGFEVGDGPRHAVLHPKGTHLYTLCELSSTLVTHSLSSPSSPISRHSILPPYDAEHNNGPKMLACEIILLKALSAGGKHLLICSNRDSPNPAKDAVALFAVDDDGSLERVKEQPWIEGVGKHVRGVAADPSERWVLMAGRDDGVVKMFERVGKDGLQLEEVAKIDVEQVVCPLWV